MIRVLIVLILASLVACGPTPVPIVPPPDQDTCRGAQFSYLIGQDATALERVLIMRPVRIVRPGDALTMDFRSNRINFELSETGQIARITCG